MKKSLVLKVLVVMIFFIFIISKVVFADEIDEDLDFVWLKNEIINASANPTEEPTLSSRYVVCFDRDSKTILYGKNENSKTKMASTTKIMTAIVLLENLEKNGLSLESEVEVCSQAAGIGGSRLGLKTGDKITINDLLYGLMLCSGNDCAIQIAVSISGSVENFAELMNEKAKELGLKNTHFVTPHGLDNEEHYTTALELAKIADYALNIKKIAQVVETKTYTVSINGYPKTINNTNELLGYLEGVNGVKTGFTNGAGRCLVTSVERNGFNIITVVLGADTKKIRTKDSIKLIEYIYSNYEVIDLEKIIDDEYNKWVNVNKNKFIINKGKQNEIKLKLSKKLWKKYPIKKEEIDKVNINIACSVTLLEAPVYSNTKVAQLNVNIGNKEIMNIDIVTKENIERKAIKDYFFYCLTKII